MSRVPIEVPDLGTDGAILSLWHVPPGESVTLGERLAEVLIPGVVVEVQSPAGGVLCEVAVNLGEPIRSGSILGIIATSD